MYLILHQFHSLIVQCNFNSLSSVTCNTLSLSYPENTDLATISVLRLMDLSLLHTYFLRFIQKSLSSTLCGYLTNKPVLTYWKSSSYYSFLFTLEDVTLSVMKTISFSVIFHVNFFLQENTHHTASYWDFSLFTLAKSEAQSSILIHINVVIQECLVILTLLKVLRYLP